MLETLQRLPLAWQLAFLAGVAYILFRRVLKDLSGVANKARELERKRIQELAVLIEMHAREPELVQRLARWLRESC